MEIQQKKFVQSILLTSDAWNMYMLYSIFFLNNVKKLSSMIVTDWVWLVFWHLAEFTYVYKIKIV